MKKAITYIQFILLCTTLFMMAISYHPIIMRASRVAGLENGTILSRYITFLFIALLGVSLLRIPKLKCPLLQRYAIGVFLIFIVGMTIAALFNNYGMLKSLRSFLIVMGSILIGWTLFPTEKQLSFFLLVFGVTVAFSGLMQVFTNIGGFIIADQYLTDSKNSLGALLASSFVAFLFMWKSQKNRALRLIALFLAILSLVIIITIRARAALLTVFIILFFFYYLHSNSKTALLSLLAFIPFIIILFYFMPSSLGDYLNASIFAGTQSEDVTSGRIGTYRAAIDYLIRHPYIGDITNITDIPWIHNYLLLTLFEYGLLFAWPIIFLYFFLLIHSFKYGIEYRVTYHFMGYVIIFAPFIISIFEPTFPFGPGTVTVFNFILLGIAERSRMELCN